MMDWTIVKGKIQADGKDQDFATYLWTLRSVGQDVNIERKLILNEKRLPAVQRLGFGSAREQALISARKALGQAEVIALIRDAKPCDIPPAYQKEIGKELRKMDASKLANFLGL